MPMEKMNETPHQGANSPAASPTNNSNQFFSRCARELMELFDWFPFGLLLPCSSSFQQSHLWLKRKNELRWIAALFLHSFLNGAHSPIKKKKKGKQSINQTYLLSFLCSLSLAEPWGPAPSHNQPKDKKKREKRINKEKLKKFLNFFYYLRNSKKSLTFLCGAAHFSSLIKSTFFIQPNQPTKTTFCLWWIGGWWRLIDLMKRKESSRRLHWKVLLFKLRPHYFPFHEYFNSASFPFRENKIIIPFHNN